MAIWESFFTFCVLIQFAIANFDHCEAKGCFKKNLNYGASVGQIETLISKSMSCSQSIKVECVLAPIFDLVSFSHIRFRHYFSSKSLWRQLQESQGCQKVVIYFKNKCQVLLLRLSQNWRNFEKLSKLNKNFQRSPIF